MSLFTYGLIVLTVILVLTVLYYVNTVYYGDDTKTITDEEKVVLNIIEKQQKDLVSQKQISNELDWSDARIARVCSSLQSKGIVRKERDQTGVEIAKISND